MRILTSLAVLAGAVLAGTTGALAPAFAADLDDYPPPYYAEPRPVPPAFVPDRVPPVVVRPLVYPRPVVYPRIVRPYGYVVARPVERVYDEPRDYGEAYSRPLPPRVSRDREDFGRDRYGYEHDSYRREREGDRYGHYLSRDELERRAERQRGSDERDRFADRGPGRDFGRDDRLADRDRGFRRDDRFADRGLGRDLDR